MAAEFTRYRDQYVFCEETATGEGPCYGFGALFLDYNRRGTFHELWEEAAPEGDERVEWARTDQETLHDFMRVVDFFFAHPWLRFHALRAVGTDERADRLEGTDPGDRLEPYAGFLADKLSWFSRDHQLHRFRIKAPHIPFASDAPLESSRTPGGHILAASRGLDYELHFIEEESTPSPGAQICDLLLGAALAPLADSDLSGPERTLCKYIAAKVGPRWEDLRYRTFPDIWKFNIWHWHPAADSPSRETRQVWPNWKA